MILGSLKSLLGSVRALLGGVQSSVTPPPVTTGRGYFPRHYFAARYFPPRYFPGVNNTNPPIVVDWFDGLTTSIRLTGVGH